MSEIIEGIVAGRQAVRKEVSKTDDKGFFKFERIEIGAERIYALIVPQPNPIDDMFAPITGVRMSMAVETWVYHYNGENHVDAYDPSGKKHAYDLSENVRLDQLYDMIQQSFPSHMRSDICF
ncbi:MAG: hypothetical protein WC819_03650 [Parcubacteria group bacterium]